MSKSRQGRWEEGRKESTQWLREQVEIPQQLKNQGDMQQSGRGTVFWNDALRLDMDQLVGIRLPPCAGACTLFGYSPPDCGCRYYPTGGHTFLKNLRQHDPAPPQNSQIVHAMI